MLKASGLTKSYGPLQVLKGVDVEVSRGEVVTIVGASGAGKSTLLHILGTLDKADQGMVDMNGVNLLTLSDQELASFRNKQIGFVFQFHNLLAEFTAVENVMIPGLIARRPVDQVREEAIQWLRRLGLEARMHHKPAQLSGGEQQRTAVARALINSPLVILADEPSGNLDSAHALELHQLFFKLREEIGQTFIIVTHNSELAAMSDRQIRLRDGRVEA